MLKNPILMRFSFISLISCILFIPSLFTSNETRKSDVSGLNHIAIIADGNRRWAKENGLDPIDGHNEGFVNTVPHVTEALWKKGIHTVTIWGFSTENWNRDTVEIENIMQCFDKLLKKMRPIAQKYNAKIIHLGRKDHIPKYLLETICEMEKENQSISSTSHIFNLAIDFGGRDEIIRAIQKIQSSSTSIKEITEEQISKALDVANQPYPNPDLMIRTAGELRLSGFMMWEAKYAELYFINKYFPAIEEEDLEEAIVSFQKRVRTFSK
jgi:undecaprenyl diphosphate synthase